MNCLAGSVFWGGFRVGFPDVIKGCLVGGAEFFRGGFPEMVGPDVTCLVGCGYVALLWGGFSDVVKAGLVGRGLEVVVLGLGGTFAPLNKTKHLQCCNCKS